MTSTETSPIIVFGMHRSGTSLVARLLQDLGVHIGSELNEHAEAIEPFEINRRLLRSRGAYWARVGPFVEALQQEAFLTECSAFASHTLRGSWSAPTARSLWGWKDPRNTITLPVWTSVFPEARLIHVVRNGLDVALSLQRREQRLFFHKRPEGRLLPPTIRAAYRLWVTYVRLGFEHQERSPHCLQIRYEDLVTDGERCVLRMARFLETGTCPDQVARIARSRIRPPRQKNLFELAQQRWARISDPEALDEAGYLENRT